MLPFLLFFAPSAAGWTGEALVARDDLPIRWWADRADPDSLPPGYAIAAIRQAHQDWESASGCALFEEVGDPEVAHFRWQANHDEFLLSDGLYALEYRSTIHINLQAPWATSDEIAAGLCHRANGFYSFAVHTAGHSMGLGHSCEESDPCTPELRRSTMYWTGPSCDETRATLQPDDISGARRLYGPPAELRCELAEDLVTCTMDAPGATDLSWHHRATGAQQGPRATFPVGMPGWQDYRACWTVADDPVCPGQTCDVVRLWVPLEWEDAPDPQVATDGGCGCRSAPGGALPWIALLLLPLVRRRG